ARQFSQPDRRSAHRPSSRSTRCAYPSIPRLLRNSRTTGQNADQTSCSFPVRWLSLLSVLLFAAVVSSSKPAAAAPAKLRLMTYNLNYANPDVNATLDAIAA